MDIRYGFDIALDLAQPTTFLTMMDVHSDFRAGVVGETALELEPIIPAERFVDDCGNVVRRLSAPAGATSLRLQGVFRTDGRADEADPAAEAAPVIGLPPDTLPFLRPSRYCETELCRISPGRISAQYLAAGQKFRRSATSSISVFDSVIPRRARPVPRTKLWGGRRRLSRFHSSGGRVMPLPQYPGALLQWLPGRHRRAAGSRRRWISTRGSKFSSAVGGLPSTPGTTSLESVAS